MCGGPAARWERFLNFFSTKALCDVQRRRRRGEISLAHFAGQVRHEFFTEDWLHLSRAGYLLWAAQVGACLSEILPSS